ncbi:hypothetical protein E2C01_051568 [Portunus trituberculatus]|uniref:Uncharacterized protein n=1 Tax=Portunus trituberculatus TaxID=210409 RepID=A0A5B7GJN9_PORTR|nr:hypothetical protein [Portunus trituberculatus]
MVASKAFHLIDSPPLTNCLQPLSHSYNVAYLASSTAIFMLTLLLILLTACLLPLTLTLSKSNARVNQYSQSFIPFSGKLWNSLPDYVFPTSYDLPLL